MINDSKFSDYDFENQHSFWYIIDMYRSTDYHYLSTDHRMILL